jgi:Tol biopolymer transport system component/DNA-binding winged helix-turn-helix (wHTH) protein
LKDRAVYQFGDYSLDATAKVLFREGHPVHLTRKAVETLLVLVENSGQVVTKQEIMAAVWNDRVVDEANLAQNIAMIRRVLAARPGEPAHIETFPGRGYRIEGPVNPVPATATAPEAHTASLRPVSRRFWRIGALGAIVGLVAALAWMLVRDRPAPAGENFRIVAVTRMPGKEFQPAISPDGARIAFLWSQDGTGPPGVWIKDTREGAPRALSRTPGHHSSPAWSADGRSLAFLRIGGASTEVIVAGVEGSVERTVARLEPPNYGFDSRLLDWSRDGVWLVVSHSPGSDRSPGLVLISAITGEKRVLTEPGPEVAGDFDPRFSPDGRTIAFARMFHRLHQEVFTVPASGGAPSQETRYGGQISGVDWSRHGRSLVFASTRGGDFRLWRMRLDASGPERGPSPAGVYGEFPIQFSVAREAPALVYSMLHQDRNIWRLDLRDKSWKRLVASSGQDASPQYSPTGDRIVFRSDRSGEEQLWVVNADGSGAEQVTRGAERPSVGRWSPDGRSIAFNNPLTHELFLATRQEGGWSVRRIGAGGVHPVFSPDGRWIYAGGLDGLRRIPASGGAAEPLAKSPGLSLDVSGDGRWLFFVREPNDTALWRLELENGEIAKVLDGLIPGCTSCWAPARDGVYFLGTDRQSFDRQILYFQEFRTRRNRVIAEYPEPLWPQGSGPFSLSPDGRYLLAVRVDPSNSDAMLVEPFH